MEVFLIIFPAQCCCSLTQKYAILIRCYIFKSSLEMDDDIVVGGVIHLPEAPNYLG